MTNLENVDNFSGLNGTKIARIGSVSYFMATQLKDQIVYLNNLGLHVVVISGKGPELQRFEFSGSLQYESIEISRTISLLKDLIALTKLSRIFLKHRFSIIHSTTPKAGLLSAVAGFLAGVPVRLHTFTGQPWVHRKGLVRITARLCDRIIALLNTKCYADSRSQMEFLIEERIIAHNKIDVIGAGSLAGVDLKRFDPERWNHEDKKRLKERLRIPPDSKVMLFIGRITKDKGIAELIEAFNGLVQQNYNVDLLLLGPLDQDCGGRESISLDSLATSGRIHYLGYDDHPERYLAISDVLCLPSYREGFGTVVIEAAAMGIPCVGTNIYGLKDSIIDGNTGILVPPRSAKAFGDALKYLLDNPEMITSMGRKARTRVCEEFDSRKINKKTADEYAFHLRALKV